MGKITIAIDGYSSTGKSTLAKQLAKTLGYVYIDTGAMYRAVTLYALRHGFVGGAPAEADVVPMDAEPAVAERADTERADTERAEMLNADALVAALPDVQLHFEPNAELGFSEMYLNGENVEKEIRQMEVSRYVSQVAEIGPVRSKLVELQQAMGADKGVVMDGRDIGTTVFPDAELKIFMTASPQARATRRYKELLGKGESVSYEEVLENVQNRDHIDSHRKISPLRKAEDAITFDNSDMGLKEQFERLHSIALRYIEAA